MAGLSQLLIASIGFIPWLIYIIMTYYSTNYSSVSHAEGPTVGFGGYLLAIGVIYALYKWYSLAFDKKEVRISFGRLTLMSVLQILVVAIVYTNSVNASLGSGNPFFGPGGASAFVLFFTIIKFLIFPIFLAFLWRAVGHTLLRYISSWSTTPLRIRFGVEVSVGIFVFSTLLLILGALHLLTLTGLIGVCIVLAILAYPGWKETYHDIRTRVISFDQHAGDAGTLPWFNLRLITAELAFFVVTFLMSVSLVNAIRPMPIGWDDLGVYMNLPRIMALSGETLQGAGMYVWQLITATGFLWDHIATQAFYVNQLGGILAIIVIVSVLSYLFEISGKKQFIALPIVLGIVYYMMPMTVFQQAKDMKLDPALMTITVSSFGLLWYTLRNEISKRQEYLYLIGIVGVLTGLAFATKLTSLMLIIAYLAYIAYRYLSIQGFFGFFLIFIGIFTGGHLWSRMNVWMPTDNPYLISAITIGSLVIGTGLLLWGYYSHSRANEKKWLMTTFYLIIGIVIGLAPWMTKNALEGGILSQPIGSKSIDILLNGSGGILALDNYSAIYSPAEYASKRAAQQASSITSDGKSQNEDFGRYFGQESGLNNYLKLPVNLTFQKNQAGEFTDITYIFLAFIPSILLFVRGRRYTHMPVSRWYWMSAIAFFMLFTILYLFVKSTGSSISALMGTINLPLGYAVMLGIIALLALLVHFTIDDDIIGKRLKEVFMVLLIYGFLFLISAFGIVWYGVFIYFLFFAVIGLAALSFVSYSSNEDETLTGTKVTLSVIFVISLGYYIVVSALPHGWNNLVSAGMNEYKYGRISQDESIFTYRSDYLTSIAHLNLQDPQAAVARAASKAQSATMKKVLTPERLQAMTPQELHNILMELNIKLRQITNIPDHANILKDINTIGNSLYRDILSPDPSIANQKPIYRIGTFMTYLINNNRQRYLDDSLVFDFDTFFYDANPDTAVERMRKTGLGYLLVDLNAATIDRDPRHALTQRYEHLLSTMRSSQLKLIDTDNLCLRLAIDESKSGKIKTNQEFISLAGTNYESYSGSRQINRGVKQNQCANYIVELINKGSAPLPSYIQDLKTRIMAAKTQSEQQSIIGSAVGQSYFALFEILDAPQQTVVPVVIPTTGTGMAQSGVTNTGANK